MGSTSRRSKGVCPRRSNLRVELRVALKTAFPVLWWRSVATRTAFAVEVFIDELGRRRRSDPYEYRRALLADHPSPSAVLELAAENRQSTPLPKGRGPGHRRARSFDSFVAEGRRGDRAARTEISRWTAWSVPWIAGSRSTRT